MSKTCFLCLCLFVCPTHDQDPFDPGTTEEWVFRNAQYRPMKHEASDDDCKSIQPSKLDLVEKCCALLPYFDKDHSNLNLLQDLASIIGNLTDSDDDLDLEVAVHACVLIPLIFLRNRADSLCLLEKFYYALSNFKDSEEKEKQSALGILQNLRAVVERIRYFIDHLSEPSSTKRPVTVNTDDEDDEDLSDLNSSYLKDLMQSFG